jgi:hypothetical protein
VFIDVSHNPHLSFRQGDLTLLSGPDTLRAQTNNAFAHGASILMATPSTKYSSQRVNL